MWDLVKITQPSCGEIASNWRYVHYRGMHTAKVVVMLMHKRQAMFAPMRPESLATISTLKTRVRGRELTTVALRRLDEAEGFGHASNKIGLVPLKGRRSRG